MQLDDRGDMIIQSSNPEHPFTVVCILLGSKFWPAWQGSGFFPDMQPMKAVLSPHPFTPVASLSLETAKHPCPELGADAHQTHKPASHPQSSRWASSSSLQAAGIVERMERNLSVPPPQVCL